MFMYLCFIIQTSCILDIIKAIHANLTFKNIIMCNSLPANFILNHLIKQTHHTLKLPFSILYFRIKISLINRFYPVFHVPHCY